MLGLVQIDLWHFNVDLKLLEVSIKYFSSSNVIYLPVFMHIALHDGNILIIIKGEKCTISGRTVKGNE